ncbi:MAG: hypothetical protein N3A69_10700 [Leptospiraceae bacterium]|nr:hypothetical protein [Leptospiraceae bacterium]
MKTGRQMSKQEEKFKTVIEKNTFYFFNPDFQEKYESYINSIKQTLLVVKNQVDVKGLKKEIFFYIS